MQPKVDLEKIVGRNKDGKMIWNKEVEGISEKIADIETDMQKYYWRY